MSALQWCMPQVQGRGAGLGNELVPWARAWLMSQVLGARCLIPPFGANARGYRQYFGTSHADFIAHWVLRSTLPRVHFGEMEYRRHGSGDVIESFSRFVDELGLRQRRPLLVTTDGMWGGIHHVARAREFVRATLYRSRDAGHNLASLSARLDPEKLTVAMHVRLGDFDAPVADADAYRRRFNCTLPLHWFTTIGRQLREAFGTGVQFQIFSDGSNAELVQLRSQLAAVDTHCDRPADISDLLALSTADLLVCSVSSYSVWAAALSSAHYLWFEPQMHRHEGGLRSIWGHEPGQTQPDSPTVNAATGPLDIESKRRAWAIGMDGTLPAALLEALRRQLDQHRWRTDLVRYGVVPAPTLK